MHTSGEPLAGVKVISLNCFEDLRGSFVKTFSHSLLNASGLIFDFHEEFYSFSKKGVIRGMHFQLPPHDHDKIVYCPLGGVLDVLLDLRRGPDQGRVVSIILDSATPRLLYIPRGIAHGFKSLVDNSLMIYKTSSEYAPSHDAGIRWDSIDFDWQISAPIVSTRDAGHPALSDIKSPF